MRVQGTFGGYRGGWGAIGDYGPGVVGSELGRGRNLRARACDEEGGGGWQLSERGRGVYVEDWGQIGG